MATPQILLENAHVEVRVLDGRVVRIVRKRSPSDDPSVSDVWGPVELALSRVDRESHSLLVDVRLARGRNDAEFESSFEPARKRMTKGWRRVALVTASTSGRLQVQRYAREDAIEIRIFDDPDAAQAWLERPPG